MMLVDVCMDHDELSIIIDDDVVASSSMMLVDVCMDHDELIVCPDMNCHVGLDVGLGWI